MLQADRLRNAHQLNLDSVEEKVEYMENCDKEYEELITTLQRLSSEHRQEIMVPLTKKAFMPGELVHTGEVMVYLGDNWFVNRTVAQGIEIAKRRREKIKRELVDYRKCLDNIKNKLELTGELEDGGIVEELTEEDIRRSETRHKARVPKANVPKPRPAFTPEELSNLSTLKTEGCSSSSEEAEEEEEEEQQASQLPLKSILKKKKTDRSEDSDDADDEAEDVTITFSHSSHLPTHDDSILHPGNLQKLLRPPKESTVVEQVPKQRALSEDVESKGREKFNINTSVVAERVHPTKDTRTLEPAPPQRPVSKFKMSRNR